MYAGIKSSIIHNWGLIPESIQRMVILENDDTTFTLSETLYLCEKIGEYQWFLIITITSHIIYQMKIGKIIGTEY